jgi:DHA3 family macrolide efflux protein-like MFS transporter
MLRKERQFSILLGGNLLSKIGDGIHEFVFIITVLQVTNNGITDAGIIYFFRFIPYLVLGPIGGILSDRLSRKLLMLWADLARILVVVIFSGLLITDAATVPMLALVGMLMTALRTIFQPAFQAAIPSLVVEVHLPTANGATQIAGEIGGLIGPALGGITLTSIGSPGHVLLLDAVTYLLSALCVLAVRIPEDHLKKEGCDLKDPFTVRSLYDDFGTNLTTVIARSQLFITIFYSSACILLVGAALRILIPAMLKNASYSDSVIGYAMSLTALGTIIGALVCGKFVHDFSTRRVMLYWCVYGLAMSLLPLCIGHIPTILAACLLLGLAGAFVDVAMPTNIQKLSTNVNIGKNFSLFSTLANTGEALSGGLAGCLVFFSTVGVSITLIGVLTASIAYIGRLKSGSQE